MTKWIRHGDVILEEIKKVECKQEKAESIVLAEGEVTGHKHVLSGQLLVGMQEGQRIISVGSAELAHDSHNTLVIPEGQYRVVMQREVDLLGQVRQVLD